MKNILVTSIAASIVATSAFGQGFVLFSTGASAGAAVSTNNAVGGGAATGKTVNSANSFYYALLASTGQANVGGSTAADIASAPVMGLLGNGTLTGWELVGIAANQASAGRFGSLSQGSTSAGQAALNTDGSLTVQGVSGGSSANFVSVGWSANIGSTFGSLVSFLSAPSGTYWIGESPVVDGLTIGDGNLVGTPNEQTTGGGYTLGEVVAAPEPGTLALAALGGASLLLFRRKK